MDYKFAINNYATKLKLIEFKTLFRSLAQETC